MSPKMKDLKVGDSVRMLAAEIARELILSGE